MFGKTVKAKGKIDSLIGSGTTIEGNILFSGGLRVDGEIHGNVIAKGDAPGMLVVSEQARIDGEVSVSHLIVNGTINGPIRSDGFLELQPNARITGDVEYNTIEMHLGAIVQGRLVHQGAAEKSVELKLAASH